MDRAVGPQDAELEAERIARRDRLIDGVAEHLPVVGMDRLDIALERRRFLLRIEAVLTEDRVRPGQRPKRTSHSQKPVPDEASTISSRSSRLSTAAAMALSSTSDAARRSLDVRRLAMSQVTVIPPTT